MAARVGLEIIRREQEAWRQFLKRDYRLASTGMFQHSRA